MGIFPNGTRGNQRSCKYKLSHCILKSFQGSNRKEKSSQFIGGSSLILLKYFEN